MKKTLPPEEQENVQLYAIYSDEEDEDGTVRPIAYAYGKPWVAQALYMDDLKFDTPDEAIKWWNENYGEAER